MTKNNLDTPHPNWERGDRYSTGISLSWAGGWLSLVSPSPLCTRLVRTCLHTVGTFITYTYYSLRVPSVHTCVRNYSRSKNQLCAKLQKNGRHSFELFYCCAGSRDTSFMTVQATAVVKWKCLANVLLFGKHWRGEKAAALVNFACCPGLWAKRWDVEY